FVLSHLRGYPCIGFRALAVFTLSVEEILRIAQADECLLKGIRSVFLRSIYARDLHGVLGLGKLQRPLRIHFYGLVLGAIQNILAALPKFILRVDLLAGTGDV